MQHLLSIFQVQRNVQLSRSLFVVSATTIRIPTGLFLNLNFAIVERIDVESEFRELEL